MNPNPMIQKRLDDQDDEKENVVLREYAQQSNAAMKIITHTPIAADRGPLIVMLMRLMMQHGSPFRVLDFGGHYGEVLWTLKPPAPWFSVGVDHHGHT